MQTHKRFRIEYSDREYGDIIFIKKAFIIIYIQSFLLIKKKLKQSICT